MQPKILGFKAIARTTRRTTNFDKVLINQVMDMPVDRLARNAKGFSHGFSEIQRMFFDRIQDKLADFLAAFAYTGHELALSLSI